MVEYFTILKQLEPSPSQYHPVPLEPTTCRICQGKGEYRISWASFYNGKQYVPWGSENKICWYCLGCGRDSPWVWVFLLDPGDDDED